MVLKYYENPCKDDLIWALHLIKTHSERLVTMNAKLLSHNDLKVPTSTKESLRTVFLIDYLSLAWPSLL